MMISIHLTELRKRLGKNQALDGVTDQFEPALLHGIIGPDGAGKTTLLRILVGLLAPDSGKVAYYKNGKPTGFAEVRPQFAYMPQQQSLYPDLSVYGFFPRFISNTRRGLCAPPRRTAQADQVGKFY